MSHCTCGGERCFGYRGDYDNFTCLCECHDVRFAEADGRQFCQAHDKRYAEPDWTACRFHRAYRHATEKVT